MTILQLKYVVAIAASSSMREASSKLFVSQPALSATVRDLEEELKIKIFERSNKGIKLTAQGEELLNYAKQAVVQYELVENKYLNLTDSKEFYAVSTQHYVFAVHSFLRAVERKNVQKYVYFINETRTDEVLANVKNYKSEIGVFSFTEQNKPVIQKLLREYDLEFSPLMICDTYAYLSSLHPLAKKKEISIEELKEYPCVTFDQTSETEFYLSEEALSDYDFDKIIRTNDRATSCEIIKMLNGFAIGTGIMMDSQALDDMFVSVKLKEQDPLTIGYVVKKNRILSSFGETYLDELSKYKVL